MKNAKFITTVFLTLVILSQPTLAAQSSIEPGLEKKLISVCEVLKTNSRLKLKQVLKATGISRKVISKGLVCNGMDAVTFARSFDADESANFIAAAYKPKYNELLSKN
jgi:hypothetical protein